MFYCSSLFFLAKGHSATFQTEKLSSGSILCPLSLESSLKTYLCRGEVAPRPGVHEGLGVEPVDGVGHPVVKVEDVLDGDVGPAPTRTPSYGKQTVLNPDTELFGSDPNPAIMKTNLRYLKKFWK